MTKIKIQLKNFDCRKIQKLIKFGYWNIEGLNISSTLPKLDDPRLLNKIKEHDIFCIAETHCDERQNINIQGYKCVQVCRPKSKKINRCFGGIAVLYKENLQEGIRIIETRKDYLWLKLSKSYFGLSKDMYVCLAYIPPENSAFYKSRGENTISNIEKDLMKYNTLGHTLLVGDLNARTNLELDFIENDHNNGVRNNTFYIADKNIIGRNSEDTGASCTRGKALVELCISAQMRIMNGRCLGDSGGRYTCYKYNGCSVVDYVITNESNMRYVLYMQVKDFEGDMSDHCCLSWAIRSNYFEHKVELNASKPFPSNFIWDKSSIVKYQGAFSKESIQSLVRKFMNGNQKMENISIDVQLSNVSNIYIEAANLSLHKGKSNKYSRKGTLKHKKWFNVNLQTLKKEVIRLGKTLQSKPNDPNVRSAFF